MFEIILSIKRMQLFAKFIEQNSKSQKLIVNSQKSENSTLRLLNDEIKKIHKQHIEAVNIQHQSEMELLADLVTFMRIKGSL